MDDTPLLEIRHLDKVYENGFHADKDVSFSIPSGKLVGLIGPNGCGKTTLMRCINKMHEATSGDILIDGESVLPMTPAQVARLVSNVPAEMTASFGLTVFETVMLGRYPYLQNMWWAPRCQAYCQTCRRPPQRISPTRTPRKPCGHHPHPRRSYRS